MTTRQQSETNSYIVAGAIAAKIMGVKNAQADPLAWAEATHLLVQYKQPGFIKFYGNKLLSDLPENDQ